MPYDDRFWLPRRREASWLSHDFAYDELHDYDFEMRGPYEPGKLLDAYMEWREFQQANRFDAEGRPRTWPGSALEELRRWEAWRRARRRGLAGPGREWPERRPGPPRGPRWPREGL